MIKYVILNKKFKNSKLKIKKQKNPNNNNKKKIDAFYIQKVFTYK